MSRRPLVALGLAGLLLTGCAGAPRPVPRPTPPALAAAQGMLDARSQAVRARNLAGFSATVASSATAAQRQAQLHSFTSATVLPFRSWSLQIAAHAGDPPARGPWVLLATLSYAFAGYDESPVTLPRTLSLTRSGGGWTVIADTQLNAPWDFGPLTVIAGARSLVIAGQGRQAAAKPVAAIAEAAVPVVTRAWGADWAQKVVVVIPSTLAQLESEVGTTSDLSQLAAVQPVELGGARTATGDRILLNPGVFLGKTSALGQRVVLAHEITHVASAAATTRNVPLWLVEGLADTVGFGTTTLTPAEGAPELAAAVKSGDTPTGLPANTDFSATSATLVEVYDQAWLACLLIKKTVGLTQLVALYRAVGAGQPVETALVRTLHTTLAHFVATWQASLRSELT